MASKVQTTPSARSSLTVPAARKARSSLSTCTSGASSCRNPIVARAVRWRRRGQLSAFRSVCPRLTQPSSHPLPPSLAPFLPLYLYPISISIRPSPLPSLLPLPSPHNLPPLFPSPSPFLLRSLSSSPPAPPAPS